jgi:hypothetical protein
MRSAPANGDDDPVQRIDTSSFVIPIPYFLFAGFPLARSAAKLDSQPKDQRRDLELRLGAEKKDELWMVVNRKMGRVNSGQ